MWSLDEKKKKNQTTHRAEETALVSEALAAHTWGPEFGSPAPVYEAGGGGAHL